jgi:hypothetical protein
VGIFFISAAVLTACGKKGDPLPPLLRVPVAPPEFRVTRIDNEVYAEFTAPAVNADGVGPADIARVEVYAITADRLPEIDDQEELRQLSTLVGSEQIRQVLPSPPPPKEGMPPIPTLPAGPGVDQGARVVIREMLTPEAMTPVALPADRSTGERDPIDMVRPLVASVDGDGPQRYYYTVGVSRRGRYGPPTHLAPVPLGPTSSAPSRPDIAVEEKGMRLRWKSPTDARGIVEPAPPNVIPSRSITPAVPPTTYDVYEVAKDPASGNATPSVPVPLTPAPVGALEFAQGNITFGTERCFVVRPVDILSGIHVRGPASPMVCASFADTFPPAPPGTVDAIAASGGISLIWEPSPTADVAGYIVMRGEGAAAELTAVMKAPFTGNTYTDIAVTPGTRYTYAVVAVDKSGNRSKESNRVEEVARQ